tara:strand:- start:191 stop:418 length:228 start_codon:yes stop_codon:yes gene_type:complete
MLIRLRILGTVFTTASLLVLVLCIGSQNINNRSEINLGITSIPALPTGFSIGISVILGVISGGMTASLLTKDQTI